MDIFKLYNMDENLGHLQKWRNHTIKSWCDKLSPVFVEYVNKLESGIICEIGVHGGASFLLAHDLIENKNIELYGIDCWELIDSINGIEKEKFTDQSLDKFKTLHCGNRTNLEEIIKYYNLSKCHLIQGFSDDKNIIDKFLDESIDAIYIDADHSFEGVYADLNNWYPKMKKNGLILGDDYPWEGVKNAAEKFATENNIKLNYIDNKFYFYK